MGVVFSSQKLKLINHLKKFSTKIGSFNNRLLLTQEVDVDILLINDKEIPLSLTANHFEIIFKVSTDMKYFQIFLKTFGRAEKYRKFINQSKNFD